MMRRFAQLLDRLYFEPQRNAKVRLLQDYFTEAGDPDRGYALAVLTGALSFRHAKPALVRALAAERTDGELFRLSHDYVGDLAETVALIWPASAEGEPPGLAAVVETLAQSGKASLPKVIAGYLDGLDATARWAFLKLITGGTRVGVSARLAKTALAEWGGVPIQEIEEVWHGLAPPYADLFAWLEGRGARPAPGIAAPFRPVMLAQPLDEAALAALDPAAFVAEWKWDGIRVQATAEGGTRRLYSRTGEDISGAFPDLVDAMDFDAAIDGELLVMRMDDGAPVVAPFNDLQQRLNRKTVTAAMLRDFPAGIVAYDLLAEGGDDLRALPFEDRRARLEAWFVQRERPRFALSPLVGFEDWPELARLRTETVRPSVEGLMLKRRDSPYLSGRPKGPWFKWKRDPHLVDAVLMYAQRGHGKRSSYYSDYTFGVWRDDQLVPVGKAYFGFTDEELRALDRFVRDHTVNRFGPVREVAHEKARGLVLEIAFEGLQASSRHRSGIAMRFPRVHRIRWDKPPAEADRLDSLEQILRQDAERDRHRLG
jgi:DNA ligase-1